MSRRNHLFSVLALLTLSLLIAFSGRLENSYAEEDKVVTSISEASEYLRDSMIQRENEICFTYITDSKSDTMLKDIFAGAVKHDPKNPVAGDYLYGHLSEYKSKYNGTLTDGIYTFNITFTVSYMSNANQEQEVTQKLKNDASAWKVSGNDFTKIKAIYDYIKKTNEYDFSKNTDLVKHSAYAALVKGSSVCQGYATLFYRMCLMNGIDCRYVTGTANGAHAWNLVNVDGAYYFVDCTWDDVNDGYDYFLKGSAAFADHVLKDSSITKNYNMAKKDYSWENAKPMTAAPTPTKAPEVTKAPVEEKVEIPQVSELHPTETPEKPAVEESVLKENSDNQLNVTEESPSVSPIVDKMMNEERRVREGVEAGLFDWSRRTTAFAYRFPALGNFGVVREQYTKKMFPVMHSLKSVHVSYFLQKIMNYVV